MAPRDLAHRVPTAGVVIVALAVVLAVWYGPALRAPFFSDDYLFLDEVRGASFLSLWAPALLAAALALLSKEPAAVLPALALVHALAIDRDPPRAALGRALPLVALVAGWAALHPALGGALGRAGPRPLLEAHAGGFGALLS